MELLQASSLNTLSSSSLYDPIIYDSTFSPAFTPSPIPTGEEPLLEDLWSFGFFWSEVVQTFFTVEQLYGAIQDLYQTIREIKEFFRPLAASFSGFDVERNSERGVSGSYFLIDREGKRHFLIKPLDEDAGCIHSDGFATPFISSPLRSDMPLYRAAMREVLAYQVALSIGVGSIVPKTVLGIFESEQFHDFGDGVHFLEMKRYLESCDSADLEKLCSVQEYVDHAKSLFEAIHELEMAGLSDAEIAHRFDQSDFEDANILLWTTYDTDGHMGNFLVYPKSVDAIGNEILGLKKIDSGLAFPDRNRRLRNNLSYLPNAKQPLSEEGKAKIAAMDIDRLVTQFEAMGLENATAALKERISFLQKLAQKPGITLEEINRAMAKIEKNP